jgi:hypothetical protein
MVADQLIYGANGTTAVQPGVGTLEYVTDPTHSHWHLLRFMRYELHRARDFALVVPDRKSGFCLGDRYNADPASRLPDEPAEPVFNTNCEPDNPDSLGLEEGISVGWGDDYEPWRDGQYLDVTGLRAGRYVLVHRVNRARLLEESRYGNNAASLLISLTWPRGKQRPPKVEVLATCPQRARCGL